METKICSKCKEEKPLTEFHKRNKDKYRTHSDHCKTCSTLRHKEYYEKNKERLKLKSNDYYKNNSAKKIKENREYWLKNKHWLKDKMKDTYARLRKKRWDDPMERMKHALSHRIWISVKKGYKSDRTLNLLQCGIQEFKLYLEKQFVTDGTRIMSWDNYGKEWHIDHIIPCKSFNLLLEEDQKKCFHYSNMQPLWKEDNISKHNKFDWNKPIEKYQPIK